ncbi:hypothetical protein PR003_g6280 [Phytophthora rubi]|uniref:Uncharacterized protein n=1 Tax=Phytophthora rubi TaxID=129364 RepID=A0A6A3N2W8_9STRA|nr:hypothetical protein PR002_g5972 [Phytophthora rubi]KAE9043223.1 hypothetical protein PR001_g5881 [Phytophthora rubi]KAE9348683.1 hypothetical protein PR003_g6280 [Phytophthora rubi]
MARGRHQVVSVVFGSDAIEYQSSSAAMNQHVGEKPAGTSKKAHENLNKECHVQFGEPGSKRDFTASSKLADPTGEVLKYRGELDAEAMDMLTRTSSCYGNDVVPYVSSTQLATQWDKKAVAETIRLRNEVRARTGPRPTRGMSYDDEVEYISEAKSAYENKFKTHKPSIMAASVKNDLRATHFSLGHDKLDNKTTSHIDRLSPDQFAIYATRPPPLHDLKKSTVEIS